MTAQLEQRQQQILDFLKGYIDAHGFSPSVRDIGKAIGVQSTSLISYYLDGLFAQNLITREKGVPRSIRIIEEDSSAPGILGQDGLLSIPYLGYIVASEPIPVEPLSGEETIELNQALFGREAGKLFALTVRGDSMIDALIGDGDTVIFKPQQYIENGEMAAVWLPDRGETTLKKVYYEGPRVRLQPANPSMEPFYVPATDVQIQGKVVLVIRRVS
ncbi:MAG: repressor LexA [Anaerolineae bacterium]|nr:repressor LexA [Anaerolineae bacterium]